MKPFTLASFNICSAHFAEGRYTQANLSRLGEKIRDSHADIVALQEVDVGAERSDRVDMPSRLSEMTGLSHAYFIKIRDFQGGQYGTAILSRFPIEKAQTVNYPVLTARQGTSCGYVTVRVDGTPVTVFNTHLSVESEAANTETLCCLGRILTEYRETQGEGFLVCGDFNTSPSRIAQFLPWISRAHDGLITYADRSIDHILYTSPFTLSHVRTMDTQSDRTTDHHMLLAVVSLPDGTDETP